MSLFRTAAKGSIQNFTIRTTTFVINFVGALILARFILPEDFGKYVIFQTYLSILFLFAFNFGQSCIYHQRLKNVFNIDVLNSLVYITIVSFIVYVSKIEYFAFIFLIFAIYNFFIFILYFNYFKDYKIKNR